MPEPILVITPGDPMGIGPEIVWKAIRRGAAQKNKVRLLCVGAEVPFQKLKAPIERIAGSFSDFESVRQSSKKIWLLPPPPAPPHVLAAGFQSGWAIQKAVELIRSGFCAGLVTGPISKARLREGGFPYNGHTDFLADLCSTPKAAKEAIMMLANSQLRVSLVTTHVALKKVPDALTADAICRAVARTIEHLQVFCGIRRPRVAVAALNPHAGESGLLGTEEQTTIAPAVARLQKNFGEGAVICGPLPADTLFANHLAALGKRGAGRTSKPFDAIVCMYHDQGLIPVKLLDFAKTVNITLGLPIVRTSVDHGVAFDIAGRGVADSSSLEEAIATAAQFVKRKAFSK